MTKLKLAEDLHLPIDAVTQTIAILAKRRAGKSFTMRRLAEQLMKASQQIVIVDPKGDQWGIRSAADGKAPGLPVIILGGERGDVPLESSSGEVVAKLVVEERVSALLDLSLFRKHEVSTFMTAFLETLYRLKAREQYRTPMMLVIDEADAVAPQKPQPGQERMLGAAEDIVRRGGQRGIGCVLVTQRSAVLNKNVLTQAEVLVALRTIAPQDLAAMKAWIDVHGTVEQCQTLMASLPSLPIGDAWFWSPGWPTIDGIFKRVHVLPIETFDSGATPKPGVKPVEPKQVADVDLAVLRTQMAATIEKAKADDPKALRGEMARLRADHADEVRTLERRQTELGLMLTDAQGKSKEVPVVKEAELKRIDSLISKADQLSTNLRNISAAIGEHVRQLREGMSKAAVPPRHAASVLSQPRPWGKTTQLAITPMNRDPESRGAENLGAGERKILTAVAQYPNGVTREQLTVLTGYKRSSRDTYLQRLAQHGDVLVSSIAGGYIVATPSGRISLGPSFEPLPTGEALQAYWLDRLTGGEQALFKILVCNYPAALDREKLSDHTGYKRSSRDTYLQRLAARQLIVADRGSVRASDLLFE